MLVNKTNLLSVVGELQNVAHADVTVLVYDLTHPMIGSETDTRH